MHLFHKILGGMANSEDIVGTAPDEQFDQGLHCIRITTIVCK